jgi:hypothetical protein
MPRDPFTLGLPTPGGEPVPDHPGNPAREPEDRTGYPIAPATPRSQPDSLTGSHRGVTPRGGHSFGRKRT